MHMEIVKKIPTDLIGPNRPIGELVVERDDRRSAQARARPAARDEAAGQAPTLPTCCRGWIAEQDHLWRAGRG